MILIGIPTHNGLFINEAVKAMLQTHYNGSVGLPAPVLFRTQQSSLLTRGFNQMWCDALNLRKEGCTHFLLWHADIEPEPHFLRKMWDIMTKNKADILSCVVPIKNPSLNGHTSTAYDEPTGVRRLTFSELPQGTFEHELLLVNSGLMLISLKKDWVEKVCFRFEDWLEKDENGFFRANGISEDWLFSRDARKLGARIFATREINLIHYGSFGYPNFGWDNAQSS